MSGFKKTKKAQGVAALSISPEGVAFVRIKDIQSAPIKCDACGFHSCANPKSLERCIAEIVTTNGAHGADCNWVLYPGQYRLLLVDIPNVPADEYKSAIRWQIKEMVDYSVDDLVVDVFLPSKDVAEYHKKLYVVAARKTFLQETVNIIHNSQLNVVSIDIPELAMRNLVSITVGNNEFNSVVQVMEKSSILTIMKNENIYFARHIGQGMSKVIDPMVVDSFVAELRKSFDYCSRQLKQDLTNSKVLLTPAMRNNDSIQAKLVESLGVEIGILDVTKSLNYSRPLTAELQERCYIAIGGALRARVEK